MSRFYEQIQGCIMGGEKITVNLEDKGKDGWDILGTVFSIVGPIALALIAWFTLSLEEKVALLQEQEDRLQRVKFGKDRNDIVRNATIEHDEKLSNIKEGIFRRLQIVASENTCTEFYKKVQLEQVLFQYLAQDLQKVEEKIKTLANREQQDQKALFSNSKGAHQNLANTSAQQPLLLADSLGLDGKLDDPQELIQFIQGVTVSLLASNDCPFSKQVISSSGGILQLTQEDKSVFDDWFKPKNQNIFPAGLNVSFNKQALNTPTKFALFQSVAEFEGAETSNVTTLNPIGWQFTKDSVWLNVPISYCKAFEHDSTLLVKNINAIGQVEAETCVKKPDTGLYFKFGIPQGGRYLTACEKCDPTSGKSSDNTQKGDVAIENFSQRAANNTATSLDNAINDNSRSEISANDSQDSPRDLSEILIQEPFYNTGWIYMGQYRNNGWVTKEVAKRNVSIIKADGSPFFEKDTSLPFRKYGAYVTSEKAKFVVNSSPDPKVTFTLNIRESKPSFFGALGRVIDVMSQGQEGNITQMYSTFRDHVWAKVEYSTFKNFKVLANNSEWLKINVDKTKALDISVVSTDFISVNIGDITGKAKDRTDANGIAGKWPDQAKKLGAPIGALVIKFSDKRDSPVTLVGNSKQFKPQQLKTDYIYLKINDFKYDDNRGFFELTIKQYDES